MSAALIVLVVRLRRPLLRSRASRLLLLATPLVVATTMALPHTSIAPLLGFVPLPKPFLATLALIVLAYGARAEVVKRWFPAWIPRRDLHRQPQDHKPASARSGETARRGVRLPNDQCSAALGTWQWSWGYGSCNRGTKTRSSSNKRAATTPGGD